MYIIKIDRSVIDNLLFQTARSTTVPGSRITSSDNYGVSFIPDTVETISDPQYLQPKIPPIYIILRMNYTRIYYFLCTLSTRPTLTRFVRT